MRNSAKPVITVSLLPKEWGEKEYQHCFNLLLAAAQSVSTLQVKDETDFIVLFPKDAMEKGLGTEIVIDVHIPLSSRAYHSDGYKVGRAVFEAMEELLPEAYVQCTAGGFSRSEFYTRGDDEETSEEHVISILKDEGVEIAGHLADKILSRYGARPSINSVLRTLRRLKEKGLVEEERLEAPFPFSSKQGWKLL